MFTDPLKILSSFGLGTNMIVADLGAGTGFYSIACAQIARDGKVYAIEVQKDFLETIRSKAKEANVTNIECLWGDVEKVGGTKLADSICDVVLISNVLCYAEDKENLLKEAKRILKPNARVLLIELEEDSVIISKKHNLCISKEKAKELFQKNGFISEKIIDVGAHHYGMIFRSNKV